MSNHHSIDLLLQIASKIDEKTRYDLEDNFSELIDVLMSDNLDDSKKLKLLKQISLYVKKKAFEEVASSNHEEVFVDLKKVRSFIANGRNLTESEVKTLTPRLWRAIKKLTSYVGSHEIENQLAYSLKIENYRLTEKGFSPIRVVNWYKKYYEILEPEYQRYIFSEILMRIFSDKEFFQYLDS